MKKISSDSLDWRAGPIVETGEADRHVKNGDDRGGLGSSLASSGERSGGDRRSGKFVGSKGGAGVWQRIISEMPPHDFYVEAFAGTGQVLLHKRPARASIAIDGDAPVCARLRRSVLPG